MDIDKIFGHPLADKSAVGCDKSAPTVWPREFVNLHNFARTLLFSSTHNKTSLDQIKPIRIASATACARSVTCSLR